MQPPSRPRFQRAQTIASQITFEDLQTHFERPIVHVAKSYGICVTLLKKVCRKFGIQRWPNREIQSIKKSIASMEQLFDVTPNSQRRAIEDQIRVLQDKIAVLRHCPGTKTKTTLSPMTQKSKGYPMPAPRRSLFVQSAKFRPMLQLRPLHRVTPHPHRLPMSMADILTPLVN